MSSNVVAELDTALQAMQDLKAPGVSGSRIQSITTLCTNNIQVSCRYAPQQKILRATVADNIPL